MKFIQFRLYVWIWSLWTARHHPVLILFIVKFCVCVRSLSDTTNQNIHDTSTKCTDARFFSLTWKKKHYTSTSITVMDKIISLYQFFVFFFKFKDFFRFSRFESWNSNSNSWIWYTMLIVTILVAGRILSFWVNTLYISAHLLQYFYKVHEKLSFHHEFFFQIHDTHKNIRNSIKSQKKSYKLRKTFRIQTI